jgi:hypothetical protein
MMDARLKGAAATNFRSLPPSIIEGGPTGYADLGTLKKLIGQRAV